MAAGGGKGFEFFSVNMGRETEIWGFYSFATSVKYEKELKGRALKGACGVCKWNMFQSSNLQMLMLLLLFFSDAYLKFSGRLSTAFKCRTLKYFPIKDDFYIKNCSKLH